MSTLTPVLADAFALLTQDLYEHLEEADCLAQQDGEWSADDMNRARGLIDDLVLTLRGLLIEHKLQISGHCRICTATWPCPVVTTIHAFVKDPERQFAALLRARDEMNVVGIRLVSSGYDTAADR